MKNRVIVSVALTAMILVSSCGNASSKKGGKTASSAKFELPAIPSVLTSPEQRAEYLTTHYWDNFDFADTSLIRRVDFTEQAYVDFINILPLTTPEAVNLGIKTMITRSEVDTAMFAHFMDLSDKYLYDPNSPFRNDEYYIPVLEVIISSGKLDEIEKVRPRYLLEMALKNRVGAKSSDFGYTIANGSKHNMYSINADYLILFFYHPECHTCNDIREAMEASPVMNKLLEDGTLKILAMYADPDISVWKNYLGKISKQWINGYDKEQVLNPKHIYDLKASPTIYLLDRDKKVILKDATMEAVEGYLISLNKQ